MRRAEVAAGAAPRVPWAAVVGVTNPAGPRSCAGANHEHLPMTRVETRIRNAKGMHLRSAGTFVHLAARFQAQIQVATDEMSPVDGKSILGLATLGAVLGTPLIITADGPDEAEAVHALKTLVEHGFHEEP
ncbi:MAG TPA: HPr family phosphocarrier protein [Candidatus Krumholzibacteria bacterium]|nr:HPr family phosphocarrier protein [Candidatus Krumholzibacteria bacterium]